jgi:DNA-binding NarL/FixJ family response regulator
MAEPVEPGADVSPRRVWAEAYERLTAARPDEPLTLDDIERLAVAAYLTGRPTESLAAWESAHHACARLGDPARAARCAFWLAFALLNGGELARGGGWLDRAQRLLEDGGLDCVEQGYLRYSAALRSVYEGDLPAAHAGFNQAAKIGERFRAPELSALARIGQGRCRIYLGEIAEGLALLDEAMVAVGADEVSPIAAGDAYCTVIEGCQEIFDLRRAREWTAALGRWCEAQPDLVLYRGQCLVHRAEIMALHGAWTDALDEVRRACARLADPPGQGALGAATYLRAELHRLRGHLAEAEDAYRRANDLGREPQPGLALLRLAQGRFEAADGAIRRAAGEAQDPVGRARILPAYVEILLAGGDVAGARAAAEDLAATAAALDAPFVHALAAHAQGAVLLADGEAAAALAALRAAWGRCRDLDLPYQAARVRALIGEAFRALGDDEGAEMEFDAARSGFAHLGASPDVVAVEQRSRRAPSIPGGLTAREVEVLALVAQGRTNGAIAADLVISEKTVASHLGHIFTKLDVSSRSAATAFAYEHGLTRRQ